MASEKASNITPYSKPPSNRKFRNNLKYKGKESDFESTQKKLQNRKLDKARHKRTTKPPRERSLKSKAIESISHLIGSLVYSVIDISVTITEKLPFGPQVITFTIKAVYLIKKKIGKFVNFVIETLKYRIIYIPILSVLFFPFLIVVLIILSSMFGISSIAIALLSVASLIAFFIISIFLVPLLLFAIIIGGTFLLISFLISSPQGKVYDSLVSNEGKLFNAKLRDIADKFPKPKTGLSYGVKKPQLIKADRQDESIAKMLIGTEHQKESTKFNVEKSREPVSKDLNHYIKQSRLHKPTDVVEDCHFETSPLLEPHDRESNEQLTGNLNSTPPLSQDLK